MLEKLRTVLFQRLLRQTLASQDRERRTHTIESARVIGLLFDATDEKDRLEVLDFAKRLKEAHIKKKIVLLGFVDIKQPLGQTKFPQFTQKDLRWNGQPGGDAIDKFLAKDIDLLLCLNNMDVPPLAWVAAASKATMKIGVASKMPIDFDMVLEIPADKGITFFVQQLDQYLAKIVPSKYESTAAL